jgi:hypothetical protein
MSRRLLRVMVALCLGSALTACTGGGSGASGDGVVTVSAGASTACDNGLIVHHLGLAGGAVHGLVWKPYSHGSFDAGATTRQDAIKVGAQAASMAARQLSRVTTLLQTCPGLAVLQRPVTDAATRADLAARQLTAGTVDAATLGAADSALSAVESQSQTLGIPIVEREPTRAELAAAASATG